MIKILITTNEMNHEGGVVNYYRIFFKKFKSNRFELAHHTFGSRMEYFYSPWKRIVLYPFYFFLDTLRLIWRLISDRQIRIVQVSPSLIPVPLIRDGFVLLSSKLFGRQTIAFFRGWNENTLGHIKSERVTRWLFRLVYLRANLTLVLASRFKDDLVALGWKPSSIEVTTTMYEAEAALPAVDRTGETIRFLYLGRISQLKGIGELIEAAKILSDRLYEFEFVMVGHGDREGVVEEYARRVQEYGLTHRFSFKGNLSGKEKFQAFLHSDVYVFPSWTEGCPTSVLEALGAGLFVISTDVGALRDIVRDGWNGLLFGRKDANDLADKLAWACENIEEIRTYRERIEFDARNRFDTSVVIDQINACYARFYSGS
jgi:glycosyltransferase involved in cell wall biosynthesis